MDKRAREQGAIEIIQYCIVYMPDLKCIIRIEARDCYKKICEKCEHNDS